MMKFNLRELVNYRHPDPRRVWKQLLTPLPDTNSENSESNCDMFLNTLTALGEFHLQKHAVKLKFRKIMCNPYGSW